MNENSITCTTAASSLKGFLDRAQTLPACFRCLKIFREDSESGTFCQVVKFKKSKPQAVGGALCADCVKAWHRFVREGVCRDDPSE